MLVIGNTILLTYFANRLISIYQVLASLGNGNCPSCGSGAEYKSEMTVNGIYFKPHQPVISSSLVSVKQEESSSPGILQDCNFDPRDSGISLSSPLTSSTPINLSANFSKTEKRKSGSDLFSSVKRRKSYQEESELEGGLNSSNIELRPRKIEELQMEEDDDDDSVIIIETETEGESEDGSEEDIEENQLAIISPRGSDLEESYLDDSLGESFESCDESELDIDDIKALEEDLSRCESPGNNSEKGIVKERKDRGSPGGDYIVGNETVEDLPALCYNPSSKTSVSSDKIIHQKGRQKMLNKIRKRPLSERRVLHGGHPLFLQWRQEVRLAITHIKLAS